VRVCERVREISGIDLTTAAQPPPRTLTLDYEA
jgi:hypothetical protein